LKAADLDGCYMPTYVMIYLTNIPTIRSQNSQIVIHSYIVGIVSKQKYSLATKLDITATVLPSLRKEIVN
jgi:hypothetical protein